MNKYIATSNTRHQNYKESAALQVLLEALSAALEDSNDYFDETDEWLDPDITITVGGISTAFYLGGPQTQAICMFIESIAEENGYEVDFKNNTVIE